MDKLWGKHEMLEISTTKNGLYLFRFRDVDARDWVMENGPWYISRRPTILRVWQPAMEMLNIGKPLHMDSLTENQTRLSIARICIEVDLSSKFPKDARLNLTNGKCTTIRIEYPWVPHNCSHCQVFGHKVSQCPFSKAPLVPESSKPSGS